jgi:hypothetical protein
MNLERSLTPRCRAHGNAVNASQSRVACGAVDHARTGRALAWAITFNTEF